MAEDEGLEVETKLPPQLLVVADRGAVSLIVQNLLENAIKYNQPDGCICIYARAVDGKAEVTVKNNGEPIPPERAPHIFERFYRADEARSRAGNANESGAGLGLPIARWIAEAHHGLLELQCSAETGSTFVVFLPRR